MPLRDISHSSGLRICIPLESGHFPHAPSCTANLHMNTQFLPGAVDPSAGSDAWEASLVSKGVIPCASQEPVLLSSGLAWTLLLNSPMLGLR